MGDERHYRSHAAILEPNILRKAAILASTAVVGVAALALQYAFSPTPLPSTGEYFLSELAWSQIGPLSVLIALAWTFALGFYAQANPVAVGLAMMTVFPLIFIYEIRRYPTSHNLIPFELLMVAAAAVPLMLAAGLGRWLARRSRRRGFWQSETAVRTEDHAPTFSGPTDNNRVCPGCRKKIGWNDSVVSHRGRRWHHDCAFRQ